MTNSADYIKIDHLFNPGAQIIDDILIKKQFFYDSLNRIENIIESGKTLWNFKYDGLDRLIFARDADGNETEWHYDDTARTITVIEKNTGVDELSNPITQVFQHFTRLDSRCLPVEETDGLGNIIRRGFDSRQLLTYFGEANQREFITDYDVFGQPIVYKTKLAGIQISSETTYDYQKRISTTVSPISGLTKWYFDTLNRLIKIERNNEVIRYLYDKQNNIVNKIDGNGLMIKNAYTPAGLLEQQEIDSSGFIPLTDYSSYIPSLSSPLTFKYTPLGSIAQAKSNAAIIKLFYDSFERITEDSSQMGSVLYRYDDLQRKIGITFPGGRDIMYTYSAVECLVDITQNSIGSQYPGDLTLSTPRQLSASIFRIGERPLVFKFGNYVSKLSYDAGMNLVASASLLFDQ